MTETPLRLSDIAVGHRRCRIEATYRRAYRDGWREALCTVQRLTETGLTMDQSIEACQAHRHGVLTPWVRADCTHRVVPPALDVEAVWRKEALWPDR